VIDLGTVRPGSTIYIPFATFAGATGAPITLTGLAAGDVLIYKDGGTTERASTSGVTLLDTDGIDFDSKTGIHGVSINLADNDTADFYAAGSRYFVVIGDVTVDSQTVRFVAATFRIGYPGALHDTTIATLASQTSFTLTAGSADDNAYVGWLAVIHDAASAVQVELGYVSAYTGSTKTVTLAADPAVFTVAAKDNISLFPPANVRAIGGTLQTARDLGASVLLSSGTGTGQISLSSGAVLLQATQTGVTIPTVTTVGSVSGNVGGSISGTVASVTGSVGSIASGGITAASFAAGAINAAAIATGAIDADAVAADAGTEIATAVWALATRTLTANTNLNDPTAAAIADAVWDEVLSGHAGVGSTGAALSAAGGSGDPWSTALPGAYGAGTAGKILGDNLNATVGSRSSHSAADVWAVATRVLTAGTNLGTVAANVTQVNGESITTYTSATLAAAVRDVSNASPAANSLGAAVNSRASQTSVDTVDDFLDTEIAAIKAKTDNLPASPSSLDAAGVRAAVGLAAANLDTRLADVPTVAEMTARTLATADYATAAALATVDTVVDSILDDTGTAGVVVATASKAGYSLAATGLDAIVVTAPTGVATTFPAMVVQLWRRFFKRATTDAGTATLKTYADDGTTAITTQSISDDGNGNEVQGAAS
jgi:hypothetical protein